MPPQTLTATVQQSTSIRVAERRHDVARAISKSPLLVRDSPLKDNFVKQSGPGRRSQDQLPDTQQFYRLNERTGEFVRLSSVPSHQ